MTTLILTNFCLPQKANADIVDKIVAQVGNEIVTQHDVERFAPARVRAINAIKNEDERKLKWDAYYSETLDTIIDNLTLQVAAARIGIATTDKEIQDTLIRLQDRNSSLRGLISQILAREKRLTPELTFIAKNGIIRNKLLSAMLNRAIITEEDLHDFLQQGSAYKAGVEYCVELAFFDSQVQYDKLKKNKKDFKGAVESVGGTYVDMDWVRLEDVSPELRSAVAQTDEGKLSSPLTDVSGKVAVVRVVGVRASRYIPDSVRRDVTYVLMEQQMEYIFSAWYDRQKQSIVVYRFQ
ncbi:hypothetical protein RsTz2092_03050 [Deferribacterales bacterium RsTz2092]